VDTQRHHHTYNRKMFPYNSVEAVVEAVEAAVGVVVEEQKL
jgi:hypothetical protein